MDLLSRTWRALPEPVRARTRAALAAKNIGRLPERDERLEALEVILDAPTEMTFEERLFLFSLVRGTAPQRVLEIGTSQGGSALIFANALEANGSGTVVGIDPMPRIEIPDHRFHGRFHLVTGESPGAIAEAAELAGGRFDLVLIDGMHIYSQAAADLAGAMPYLADDAYILFHDAFHYGVSEAIREAVEADPHLHDCGYVCARPRTVGLLLTHGGFRLVRRGTSAIDVGAMVKPVWDSFDLPVPHDPDLRDHDIYYCEVVEPCAYCVRERAQATPGAHA
jgi:predicted O-methyltransferase YrrM